MRRRSGERYDKRRTSYHWVITVDFYSQFVAVATCWTCCNRCKEANWGCPGIALEFGRKWLLKWKQKSRKPRPSKSFKKTKEFKSRQSRDVEFQGEMQNDAEWFQWWDKTLQDFTRLTLWKRCRFSARQLLQPLQALQQELQSKLAKLKNTEVWAGEHGELSELSWKGFPKAVCLMRLVSLDIYVMY